MRQITIDLGAYIEEKKRRERREGAVVAAVAIVAALVLVAIPRTTPPPTTPQLAPTPASLTFPTQPVGTASAAQLVRLRNDGDGALSIASLTSSDAAFRLTPDCTAALAKGASCNATIVFAPPAPGPRRGELTIATNAGTRRIALIGDAQAVTLPTPAQLAATPARLAFAAQLVGIASAAQTIQLRNDGDEPLSIGKIIANGDAFGVSNDCAKPLARNDSCGATVVFTPATPGKHTGAVAIDSNGGTATIALDGEGSETPTVELPQTDFGGTLVGAPVERVVSFVNRGTTTIVIGKSTANAPFEVSSDGCGNAKVAPGGNCAVRVLFRPATGGPVSGELSLVGTRGETVAKGALLGAGVRKPAHLTTSPASLAFAPQFPGNASAAQSVRLQNDGGEPLSIGNIDVKGAFRVTNDCGKTLAPTSSCNAAVVFAPPVAGKHSGVLAISTNGGSATIPLGGEGRPFPVIALPPTDFGRAFAGTAVERVVAVTNSGPATILVGKSSAPPPFEVSSDGCRNRKLRPGDGCEVGLKFRPTAGGNMKGELVLFDPRGEVLAKGTLRGTGMVKEQPLQLPSIDIKPREINFNGDPGKKTIAVTNIGAIPVSLSVKPETQTRYLIDTSQCNGVVLSPTKQCSIVVDGTIAVRLGTSTRIVISYAGRTEFVPVRAK